MINAHDIKRSQEDSVSRSNSFRRSNTLIVASEDDEDEDGNGQRQNGDPRTSGKCCGGG